MKSVQNTAAGAAVLFAAAGLYVAFLVAPADAQQGEVYRIAFVHVPAAWMSLLIYLAMAACAGLGLALDARLPAMTARALAPTGAIFTFLALWTGAIWGKPTWGTWWVWDARLTSELVLLVLYLGCIALDAAIEDPRRADRACALVALIGVAHVPIVYFSVTWWNTRHPGAPAAAATAPAGASTVLAGTLLMALAFGMYSIAMGLARLRCVILEREQAP